MRRSLLAVSITVLALAGSTACATKGYVNKQIADVNGKVEGLSKSVEDTQNQTKQNAQKIDQVDQNAQAGINGAKQAAGAADQAAQKAQSTADSANTTAGELAKAENLVAEVVLNDAEGNFKFGSSALPDSAKQKIDDLMNQLKANPKPVYFELDGYTDSAGNSAYNKQLGLKRAEAVRAYLYEQYQVPLHKINVYSFGEADPVAPNNTRDGRAQNRRVVIKVVQ